MDRPWAQLCLALEISTRVRQAQRCSSIVEQWFIPTLYLRSAIRAYYFNDSTQRLKIN